MKRSLTVIALIVASVAGGGVWYVQSKLPTRQGQVELPTLQEPVTVRYDERGVPHIDPVEFYQNFMKITSNMPNPSLVMKFAQNSEENSNWYLDRLRRTSPL